MDDNRELRNLIKEELTGAGYRAVRMADSVAAARQAISGELPELVILDINLPDGDGFSLFREIRGRSDIPIHARRRIPEIRRSSSCIRKGLVI